MAEFVTSNDTPISRVMESGGGFLYDDQTTAVDCRHATRQPAQLVSSRRDIGSSLQWVRAPGCPEGSRTPQNAEQLDLAPLAQATLHEMRTSRNGQEQIYPQHS